MACLLLRLKAPLQSWGYRSRFSDRDTGLEPTKSGVIGLLCCALGRDRSESVDDLVALRMHVRVDREGKILRDFQTAGAGVFRGARTYYAPKSSGGPSSNAVMQDKWYLQDASFLVALEGDRDLLGKLQDALNDPKWPLSLGRRSCPPAEPVAAGLYDEDAEGLLRKGAHIGARFVWETPAGSIAGDMRQDIPVAWASRIDRRYAVRFVRSEIHTGVNEE